MLAYLGIKLGINHGNAKKHKWVNFWQNSLRPSDDPFLVIIATCFDCKHVGQAVCPNMVEAHILPHHNVTTKLL